MDVTSLEPDSSEVRNDDRHPLLPEQMERHESRDHIVDICGDRDASSSSSSRDPPGTGTANLPAPQAESGPNGGPTYQAAPPGGRARRGGGDAYGRRRRSPLNSGLWISVELVVTVCQVVASIVVLSVSRNENPQAPLFAWVVGYASGCVAMLPVLYWRYRNRNRDSQQDSADQDSSQSVNPAPETSSSLSYTAISGNQASDEESNQASITASTRNTQSTGFLSARHNNLVDHFKMALDCFFAVWFVVGNVWIFGGHSSPSDAPKLYRLCIVFLTFSCIGYAMPFILCATICCCLPCIISVLGIREDFSQTRGATVESINLLPTYKFKLKKTGSSSNEEPDSEVAEGGILAAGTEKEREITGEDAACCICLARYAENDELRELPCTHLFHVDCVDKWLKINASCPLCKAELGEDSPSSPSH